jgi:hypothetical protein
LWSSCLPSDPRFARFTITMIFYCAKLNLWTASVV